MKGYCKVIGGTWIIQRLLKIFLKQVISKKLAFVSLKGVLNKIIMKTKTMKFNEYHFTTKKILSFIHILLFSLTAFFSTSCSDNSLDLVENINEDFVGITEIEVEGGFLNVTYVGEAGRSSTQLKAQLNASNQRRFDISYRVEGTKLIIELDTRSGLGNPRGEGFIELRGPRNMRLDLETEAGTIRVDNVVSNVIDLETTSGTIDARNLTVNTIEMSATSGTINAQDLTGALEVDVTSGKLNLSRLDGNVNAVLVSGEMTIAQVNGLVNVNNQSGNVELNQVSRIGNAFVISGQIFATNTGLANVTSPRVGSGYIYIQTNSNLRNFNFNITTGSGTARVGTTMNTGSLVLNNGATATIRGEVGTGKLEIVN